MTGINVDLALAKKYQRPGPRYTSYPPAPHFKSDIDFAEAMKIFSDQPPGPVSLYFHIPFCDSMCWFCACTNLVRSVRGKSSPYLKLIEEEVKLKASLMNEGLKVAQLHWGGGSPSFLLPDEIRMLGEMIHNNFDIPDRIEAGVEIDPRDLSLDQISAFREVGFNRVSLGVQDNNSEVQKAVNRIQPYELTAKTVENFRSAGFHSVNIDLIYGLPFQTVKSFEKTLNEIIALSPDRFAVFNFAYVPWMKASQKIIKEEALPSAETKLQILKLTVEKLTSEGYIYIGMDHFAKETDEMAIAHKNGMLQRNFQGYSPFAGDVILGFGVSSISQSSGAFLQNERDLPNYSSRIEKKEIPFLKGYILTNDDRIRRAVIMRLMCDLKLNFSALSKALNIDFRKYFEDEIEALNTFEEDGLLVRNENGFDITDTGRLFVRNIAMLFDAHLSKGEGRYSKTV